MSTPINAAAQAYGNAAKLLGQAQKPNMDQLASGAQGNDFAQFLADSVQGVVDDGKASDQKALDLVNGKGDIVDVVTAISQTEIAMETMVTVRDRVISAYEEIMRMPI
jgi:flagellar hook-basal body complex protein FliE